VERELERELREEARRLEADGLLRELGPPAAPELVDFTSSDYLGLARHPAVVAGARAAASEFGAGARAARLLGGGSPLDFELEAAVAGWLGAEAALFFPTGYQANLGTLTALAGAGDAILSDELNHASIVDAARLSRATLRVFRHADLEHAEVLLAAAGAARRRLVVTEGVFSMDGDAAPLAGLCELCARYDAWLVVDEAHATGVVGPRGAGAFADAGCDPARLAARVVTGGKALGVAGGLVVGSAGLRRHLVQRARSFVFTTGAAPAVAGGLLAAVRVAQEAETEREHVRALAAQLALTLDQPEPAAGIVPVVIGSSDAALERAARLRAAGFDLRALRPPTVPAGTARLRVTLHAFNRPDEVERLALALADLRAPAARRAAGAAASARAVPAAAPLFVAGTDTGVGKTVVAALLARAAAREGASAYWKPVQTGAESDTAEVARLCAGAPVACAEPACAFPLAAAPHEAAAEAGARIEPERLDARLGELRREHAGARLVVELAGGLLVPYDERATQADWLARVQPALVLVARSGLGTLNHTLLSLEALRARRIVPRALFLVGAPHASNRATLARAGGVAHVLELPPLEPLNGAALERWIDANETGLERVLDDCAPR